MSASYEDDIALLCEDIQRWAGADARIQEAVEQLLKLHTAEVGALAEEVRDLQKDLAIVLDPDRPSNHWRRRV